MWKSEASQSIVLGFLLISAAFFLVWVLNLRFESGDVFPAYSSSRTDPQGCKALFESLNALDNMHIERNFRPIGNIKGTGTTTLVLLGLHPDEMETLVHAGWLADFLEADGRVILGMKPYSSRPFMWEPEGSEKGSEGEPGDETEPETHDESRDPDPATDEAGNEDNPPVKEPPEWSFACLFGPQSPNEEENFQPLSSLLQVNQELPDKLPWRSGFYFHEFRDDWRITYSTENGPVCMEYTYDKGSLVVMTDSYLFSNESLWSEKQVGWLVAMLGNRGKIIFDESHLGVTSQTSISNLVFRYRFQGIVVGFLLLAVLFLWRNTSPLVPPDYTEAVYVSSEGKDASSGMVNLLERSIRPDCLLETCFEEWTKTLPNYQKESTLKKVQNLVQAEQSLEPKKRNMKKVYRDIHQQLSNRRMQ